MSRIPQRFIDDLLARIDIVEIIDAYVPLKKRGREYVACCPFHNEKTPSFTVSQDKQFYHCFGCGAHGTALGFLLDYEHLDFIDAVKALADTVGLEVPREGGRAPVAMYDDLYQILEEVACFYKQALRESPQAIDYLKSRGLSGQIALDYSLGYAPPNWEHLVDHFGESRLDDLTRAGLSKQSSEGRSQARFRNRIMFPIRDRRGRVIGFGGRVIGDSLPKYLNSPETPLFHKGEALYGLVELRRAQPRPERVLLVEGYMDVLALAQHGIRYAVATLGTATTGHHLQQLFRLTHEIVFCFDGDRAGREAAWRAAQQLLPIFKDGLEARFMFLPEGDDPDTVIRREGKEGFTKRIQSAIPLSDFLFDRLAEGLNTHDVAGRVRLAELAKPLLQKLPDGLFKELMYDELAKRIGKSLDHNPIVPGQPIPNQANSLRLTHSPVRMAITMLLHEPKLAQQAAPPAALNNLDLPGIQLLVEILETLRSNPNLNSVSLLERYRGSEYYRYLLQLMSWRPPDSEAFDLTVEFRDVIARLINKALEQRTDELLAKERNEGLSPSERGELRVLLTRKTGILATSTEKKDKSAL